MDRRDRFLTELAFIAGLILLPSDGLLWGVGTPTLLVASALASGIAWELPRLLFPRKVGAADQLASSVALTVVLLSFYLGRSDAAVAALIREKGQNAAFQSPQWLASDIVLSLLTLSAMLSLLALTTVFFHFGSGSLRSWLKGLPEAIGRCFVGLILGGIVGLGAGAWVVAASTYGPGLGIGTWMALWSTVEVSRLLAGRASGFLRLLASLSAATVAGCIVAGVLGGPRMILWAALAGAVGAVAHHLMVSVLPAESDRRPKEAPLHIPWVGFYTLRFSGLLVAYFALGTPFLWGLRPMEP